MSAAPYRIVVVDQGVTYRFPQDSYADAYRNWRALHDHARDHVQFKLQRRLGVRWVDIADPGPPTGGAAA